jgi:NADPH:quinone reductase-like Zn-dependent oxidoreductase
MRAVVIETFGGPEVMRMLDLPIPEPGPGQDDIRRLALSFESAHSSGRRSGA